MKKITITLAMLFSFISFAQEEFLGTWVSDGTVYVMDIFKFNEEFKILNYNSIKELDIEDKIVVDDTKTLKRDRFRNFLGRYGIIFIFFVLIITISFLSNNFYKISNILNVLRQISIIAILGMGVTPVIISGGIDLSIGKSIALCGVVAAMFAHPNTYPLIVPIIFAITIGVLVGTTNGIIVSFGKIPAFIATLGTMSIITGVVFLITEGYPIGNFSEKFLFIGRGILIGIPFPIIILVVLALINHFILNNTAFGRYIYAIGGNIQAAITAGINIKMVQISVYIWASTLASISGIIFASRVMSGYPRAGIGYEFDAITAAVIGGTSLMGGVGTIPGTLIGALIIGVINNGMDLLNISAYVFL